MARQQYTIELPVTVGRHVERAAKRENRKISDVAVEALRRYFSIPTVQPTAGELRAIRRGEAAFKRGDYITLDELRREEKVGRRHHRSRAKIS
jgi:predicted transcriptional regulator